MQNLPVQIGELIDGKFRVEGMLGQGAMGLVLRAKHVMLNVDVAVKVLFTGGPTTAKHEARFTREVRVAAKLHTEHAIRLFDTGVLRSGAAYVAMELLEGDDLAALLKKRGALPVEEAVTYVLQACEVVAEAHVSGVVHRDLKPANLFLTKGFLDKPTVKVLDFGVAKLRGDEQRLTMTGEILGSPLYMSPEQMRADPDIDGRSDIWALGVILFELLAEAPPFVAETLPALIMRVNTEEPTPLASLRPDVPAGLCAIIAQCLQKDRARRWPTVAALAAALAPYAPRAMAEYVGRVARVESVDVEPARPTNLLPSEPKPAPFVRELHEVPPQPVPTMAPAPTPARTAADAQTTAQSASSRGASWNPRALVVGAIVCGGVIAMGLVGWRWVGNTGARAATPPTPIAIPLPPEPAPLPIGSDSSPVPEEPTAPSVSPVSSSSTAPSSAPATAASHVTPHTPPPAAAKPPAGKSAPSADDWGPRR